MSSALLTQPTATASVALKLNLVSEAGRHLTSEPVTDADLENLRSEAWFTAFVRRGMAGVPFSDIAFRVVPILKADSEIVCAGFALEADSPRGGVARCEFPRRVLLEVANRAAERLLKLGVLDPDDKYLFEIVVDPEPRRIAVAEADIVSGNVSVKNPPFHFLSLPLRPLIQHSHAVDELDEEAFHVFVTEGALAASERFSRKGAGESKPIETGAALAGQLCLADDGGEGGGDCFVIVTDVLEAVNSKGTEFSLTYSIESWTRISRIMNARQAAQPAFRLCGSAHGHNFSPGEPCASCFKTSAPCGAHNVMPSTSDLLWTTSVFAHQPWALCHIFGTNARGEALNGLFTLRHGQLRRRGFFVLPAFDLGRWKTICATDLNSK